MCVEHADVNEHQGEAHQSCCTCLIRHAPVDTLAGISKVWISIVVTIIAHAHVLCCISMPVLLEGHGTELKQTAPSKLEWLQVAWR